MLKFIAFQKVKRMAEKLDGYKSQLSNKILKEIEKINIGGLTNPITTAGGFILLKINEKKNN